jgi:outer membrane biosynthesis protein TonB
MKVDWAISAVAHAGLLAWGLVSFAAKPFEAPPESVPVDIVSATEYSQLMAGSKNAKKAETPKPLVEKVAEKKLVEDPTPKISEKKEIKEAKAEPPPPMPEPRPKPPQPTEAKKEPKVDEIAEALKKENAKKREEARKQQKKKVEKRVPKKPEVPAFDPTQIAALLDKRTPQRQASAGDTLNSTASLGLPSATAARLSQSEIDALRARLAQLWNPPVGAKTPDELVVRVRIRLNKDGRLAAPPTVLTSGTSVLFQTARESAIRAVFRGQPFNMLLPEHYDQWRDIEVTFDPRDMMRG